MKAADQNSILIRCTLSLAQQLFTSVSIILILATVTQAQMGYVTTYSDVAVYGGQLQELSWVDIDNPDHLAFLDSFPTGTVNATLQSGEVYGMGYTDDYYNSYNHTYWVTTSIYAPGGALIASSTGLPSSVNTFITDASSEGSYYVTSEHYYECPYSPGSTFMAGVTSASYIVQHYKLGLGWFSSPRQLGSGRYVRLCYYNNCDVLAGSCYPRYGYDIWRIANTSEATVCPFGITITTTSVPGYFYNRCFDVWVYRPTYC